MAKKKVSILRRIFPQSLWSVRTTRLWLLTLLLLLWFDLEWCMIFSFTTFQIPEVWVNTLLLSLLLAAPQMLWRLRKTQAVIITLLAILLECNLLYARTYFNAIPASSYLMAGNLSDFTASVVDSFRWLDIGFLTIIIAAWLTATTPRLSSRHPLDTPARLSYAILVAILAIISASMLLRRGGLMNAWQQLSTNDKSYFSARVPMYTIAGSVAHDLMASGAHLSSADSIEVVRWLADQPRLDSLPAPGRDNIIIILCESLESWPIGLKVQGKEITPRLNALVADTSTFYAPSVVSQVGAGRSIDGQLLINAGMLPMLSGIYATDHYSNRYLTLNQALKEKNGARSAILTVDKPHTWNQQAVARAFAIDTLIANTAWRNDEPVGSKKKLGDRAFALQIIEKMKSGEVWPVGANAFVQIVTYSGHNPFRLPENLDDLHLNPAGLDPAAWRYLTMVHYTDQAIGLLVDYITSRPDSPRTMIVITGDHEGLAWDRPAAAARHPWVNPAQMVPLIVLNAPVGGRHDKVMGQIDIYPTLLQMAGLTDYQWHGLGQSALSPSSPGVAIGSQHDLVGDTAALSPAAIRHLQQARTISDRIITFNLLNK